MVNVRVTETFITAVKEMDGAVYKWLTEEQLEELYKDPVIAKEIVKNKNKTPSPQATSPGGTSSR